MALYALVLIVLLGILFLLYCLWNFARELKPPPRRAPMFSRVSNWGIVHVIPMPRAKPQDASINPVTRAGRQDRDYTMPARVS